VEIIWHSVFFYLFAAIACCFALGVLFATNVVRMAFYLIISLAATAGLFFLAGADFVGAMQLVLYVGGTLVLLVFGVMLTAQGPFISIKTAGGEWIVAALVAGTALAVLVPIAIQVGAPHAPHAAAAAVTTPAADVTTVTPPPTATRIGMGLLGAPTDDVSGYLLPFEIISVHLLVVLVGAAYLARAKRRAKPRFADRREDTP
jgi:NADH:ubiquinone oxidoreductase subunit 6 (subunit J)